MKQGNSPWWRPLGVATTVFTIAALLALASPASALEFYVDTATGSDARSALEAQSPATPWATIGHALDTVDTAAGRHTIHVEAGTYNENAESSFPNVELKSRNGTVTVVAGPSAAGIDIDHADVLVDGFVIHGGTHGIRAENADGLVIRNCTALEATFNGFHIAHTAGVTIENSRAISNGGRGMFLDHTSLAYVRNNLTYANTDRGIDFDNTTPLSTGNIVAFNTVAYNAGGGVRLKGATGEVRDNIIANNTGIGLLIDTAGAVVQHNLLFGHTTPISPAGYALGGAMLALDPQFVDDDGADGIRGGIANHADDSFALDPASPAVDAGSGDVASRDIDGSTRQDLVADSGTADLGFHRGASASTGAPAVPAGAATYYVDPGLGNDTRDRIEAQNPATPWATIGNALAAGLVAGDTVVVAAGTYPEALVTSAPGVTVITTAGSTIEVPSSQVGITITHDDTTIDGFVIDSATNGAKHGIEVIGANGVTIRDTIIDDPNEIGVKATTSDDLLVEDVTVTTPGTRAVELTTCSSATVHGLISTGGIHAVHATGANDLAVEFANLASQTNDAIVVMGSTGVRVDSCIVDLAGSRGLYFQHTSQVYARNNKVTNSSDWGIHLDAGIDGVDPSSNGNLIAFNTVVSNGAGATNSGGIRFQNANGEIRDNVIVDNTLHGVRTDIDGSIIHHNDVFGAATTKDYDTATETIFWGNLEVDPGFVGAPDYRLTAGSPLLDVGSGNVADVDISGSARQSGAVDAGTADLGFHENAAASTGAPPPAPALPGAGPVHYVNCTTGVDGPTRTKSEARNPATPWLTVKYAASQLGFGEVVEVQDGTCNAAAEVGIDAPGTVIRTETSRGTTMVATEPNAFNIQASDVTVQGFVIQTDRRGVLADDPEGEADLEDIVIRDLEIVPATVEPFLNDKITVRDSVRPIVENNEVEGGIRGILVRRTQDAYVRNNRVSAAGDWGIQADDVNGDGDADGIIVAFNTVSGSNGIRFDDATGEIRDNIVSSSTSIGIKTDKAPVHIHHNDVFGQTNRFDTASGQEPFLWANLNVDPLFTGSDFHLSEIAAGQLSDSPVLAMGSGDVATVDISGSTRTDDAADAGIANLGFHHGASASAGIPAIEPPPGGPGPFTYFVDDATGDDDRSRFDARDPTTPWKTIGRALEAGAAAAGDTVSIKGGTYAESARTATGTIHLVADGAVNLTPGAGQIGLRIDHPNVTVTGLSVTGGLHGIRATAADGLDLRDCDVSNSQNNGIMVVQTTGATIQSCTVDTAGERGVLLEESSQVYLRNNVVSSSGEWGIHFDSEDKPVSTNNVVAFNTVYGSGVVSNGGGIRFQNATGEIRDNVVSMNTTIAVKVDTAPAYIHHNVLHGSAIEIDDETGQEPVVWNNLTSDPELVNPATGNFALSEIASGQGSNSPALDAGSADVSLTDISGSTRTDTIVDAGIANPGFHDGAGLSTGIPPVQTGPVPTPHTYYVDPINGSNANSPGAAQNPGTAWQTISFAIGQASAGDTIHLQPGTYVEDVSVNEDSLTLEGVGALGTVVVAPPAGEVGISVNDVTNVRIANLVVDGGSHGVRAENADGLRVEGIVATGQNFQGIYVIDTDDAWIDSCIVTGAGNRGISFELSTNTYTRNNLVYANASWGISIDNTTPSDPQPPLSFGNAIAFNTVYANGDGIRVLNAAGEVRDNQITNQVDLGLFLDGAFLSGHHNNFANNARDWDRNSDLVALLPMWDNVGKNPRYVNPAGLDGLLGGANWEDDNFRLQTVAAGEDFDSLSIDVGSDDVANVDIGGSTTTPGTPDTGVADIGYHYGAPPAVAIPTFKTPPPEPSRTYYTSPTLGDDSRTDTEAQNPATPWATLSMALQQAADGDTVIALPGVYVEEASVEREGLTLVSETPGGAVIHPIDGTALHVASAGVTVSGFVLRSASTGINVTPGSNDVRITNCAAVDSATDGFRATDVSGLIIENSIATGSTFSGIQLRRVQSATIQNNLAYANGEWGFSHDNTPEENPLSDGNLVALNTFTQNGIGNARLMNAVGTVRDNLLSESVTGLRIDTAGATILHNGFHDNATPLDPDGYLFCVGCTANETVVPEYVDPTGADGILGGNGWMDDDFRLAQIAAGQSPESDAVGFGSDLASSLGVNGSTSTTGSIDDGVVDLGYHYDSSMSALPAPSYTEPPLHVLYVDANIGDDARTRAEANSPATPWKTLTHAVDQALPGDTLQVAPGTYEESLRIDVQDLTIRGTGAHGTTILEPSGPVAALQRGDTRRDGVRIRATGATLENLWIRGARRGVMAGRGADGLTLEDLVVTSSDRDGIAISNADGMSLSGLILTGNRRYGIYLRKLTGVMLRDSDIYANNRGGIGLTRSTGTISFVTVYGNRDGVRSSRSTLTFRDSVVAMNDRHGFRARSTDAITLTHTVFGLNGRGDVSPEALSGGTGVQTATDPLLVDPDGADDTLGGESWEDDDLALSLSSPAIDAGSDLAANLGVTGSATGGPPDVGIADLGAHR